MKPTILFTLDIFEYGGITTYTRLYKSVVSRHFNTIIIGKRGDISNPSSLFPNSLVIEIPNIASQRLLSKFVDLFWYLRALHSLYKKYSIDIIHFSAPWSTFYSLIYPKTWRAQKIITYHGAQDLERISLSTDHSRYRNFLKNTTLHYLQYFGLIHAKNIIVLSAFAKLQLIKHYHLQNAIEKKIILIPGFVPVIKKIKHSHPRELQILNFGRAEPRKGIDLLLHALYLLKREGINFHAYIASPVSYYKWTNILETYEKYKLFTCVHFIHVVSFIEKQQLLKQASVFIMPSIELETFGLSIIESLSHGVPVIGMPVGAIPEILRPIDSHLVAKSNTAQGLKETIKWFYYLSKKEKNFLRRKSIERVKKNYSKKVLAKKILSLYRFDS